MSHRILRDKVGTAVLLALLLFVPGFWLWYAVAADYDYRTLAGTYQFRGNGEICILRLRSNRSFHEETIRSNQTQESEGYWYRYGEAHVSFSKEFQTLPGEEVNSAGEAHGQFEKILGIFPTLVLAPIPGGPKFHRLLFRSDK